jgi:predicted TIM-barrel fold metal-dependent hydrolase
MFESIDFHTHVYPELPFRRFVPEKLQHRIQQFSNYYSSFTHKIQQQIYLIPSTYRQIADPALLLFTAPSLPINSTSADLINQMDKTQTSYALITSHPPLISNEHILEQSKCFPRLFPCLSYSNESSVFKIEHFDDKPEFLLKLYPMSQNFDLNSKRLKALLDLWNRNSWPLLIHTGALHSPFFKKPEQGHVQFFAKTVQQHPQINFILVHMNIFEPQAAIDFCLEHTNTIVTTSWQSDEMILNAKSKLGAERVLFSSDWPLVGNNIEIKKNQLVRLYEKNKIHAHELEKILSVNAKSILENYFSKKL